MTSGISRLREEHARAHHLVQVLVLAGGLLFAALPGGARTAWAQQAAAPSSAESLATTSALPPLHEGMTPIEAPECPEFKEICVQAERSGGIDMKTGIATLEGNVTGVMNSKDLVFRADYLKAFRNESLEWVRLVLDDNVVFQQPDQQAGASHAILEKTRTLLFGQVSLVRPNLRLQSERVQYDEADRRSVIEGMPSAPLEIEFRTELNSAERSRLERNAAAKAKRRASSGIQLPDRSRSGFGELPSGLADEAASAAKLGETAANGLGNGTGGGRHDAVNAQPVSARGTQMETTVIRAQKAVLEEKLGRADISGSVTIQQTLRELNMSASQASLFFTEGNQLSGFRAEGNVVIVQPDRRLSADSAVSQNDMETILLIGNAKVSQPGQFDMASDRIEVYTDSQRGLVTSENEQKPVTLSLDLGASNPYAITQDRLQTLRERGVPDATLNKLSTLQGHSYPRRGDFVDDVNALISPEESQQYLPTILDAAR